MTRDALEHDLAHVDRPRVVERADQRQHQHPRQQRQQRRRQLGDQLGLLAAVVLDLLLTLAERPLQAGDVADDGRARRTLTRGAGDVEGGDLDVDRVAVVAHQLARAGPPRGEPLRGALRRRVGGQPEQSQQRRVGEQRPLRVGRAHEHAVGRVLGERGEHPRGALGLLALGDVDRCAADAVDAVVVAEREHVLEEHPHPARERDLELGDVRHAGAGHPLGDCLDLRGGRLVEQLGLRGADDLVRLAAEQRRVQAVAEGEAAREVLGVQHDRRVVGDRPQQQLLAGVGAP